MNQSLIVLSKQVGEILARRSLTIGTAESCTGGLLSHTLTGVSGASSYFLGGVVAYHNQVKKSLLGVQRDTLESLGAVSAQTAREMAAGVRQRIGADIGLSTTGIAGPTGGTPEKPVGLVFVGVSLPNETFADECHFSGDREAIKTKTVETILRKLIARLNDSREP